MSIEGRVEKGRLVREKPSFLTTAGDPEFDQKLLINDIDNLPLNITNEPT